VWKILVGPSHRGNATAPTRKGRLKHLPIVEWLVEISLYRVVAATRMAVLVAMDRATSILDFGTAVQRGARVCLAMVAARCATRSVDVQRSNGVTIRKLNGMGHESACMN
jgi:hypothetical protein